MLKTSLYKPLFEASTKEDFNGVELPHFIMANSFGDALAQASSFATSAIRLEGLTREVAQGSFAEAVSSKETNVASKGEINGQS